MQIAVFTAMRNIRSFTSLISVSVVALLTIGCSESMSTPTAATPLLPSSGGTTAVSAELLTGMWNLVSIQTTGRPEQPAPAGAAYRLAFADGRLSARADCNTCGGAFALSGETLTAGPALACTRAACPTMEFESAYTSILSGNSTVAISGETLTLSSERGVLHFAR